MDFLNDWLCPVIWVWNGDEEIAVAAANGLVYTTDTWGGRSWAYLYYAYINNAAVYRCPSQIYTPTMLPTSYNNPTYMPNIGYMHSLQANFSFVDGHVESLGVEPMLSDTNDTRWILKK